ncbi:MAG: restriction endonuclease, partial [Pseudoflavonifractor sp.]|nr:restriction endonuclease [Pseudoflavonifractor sp.]
PVIGVPVIGHTDTFLSIGKFASAEEASACLKYVKSKFARCMLGTLKATQHNPKSTWANVPMQDFKEGSDIDWSKSVAEIDAQLYAKYGLTDEEIIFIESMIKPM